MNQRKNIANSENLRPILSTVLINDNELIMTGCDEDVQECISSIAPRENKIPLFLPTQLAAPTPVCLTAMRHIIAHAQTITDH